MFSPTELALLVTTVGLVIVAYFKWSFKYWERRNLPLLHPTIPFGDFENPFNVKKGFMSQMRTFYDEFKARGMKHGGIYSITNPIYIPISPEYIKNVLAKDFQHFVDRGVYYNEKNDPLSAHLFSIEGQKWRNLRTKLTPTFTSGKMKMMFHIILKCGEQLKEKTEKIASRNDTLDVKEVFACFSTDVIGSCAFGLECNSFKDPHSNFRKYGRKVFTPSMRRVFKTFLTLSVPNLCKLFGLTVFPKDVRDFFMNVVRSMVEYREKNNFRRNDFAQLLLELKDKGNDLAERSGLTMEEIAAQAFVFFLAGFETSSTTMTFCLYELAKNQEIQNKLRREIHSVLNKTNGNITYESIMEMKYLELVINETLRKYPAVPVLNRICTEACSIPNTDVKLEKGTKVLISVYSLHHDPEFYPDPEKFIPERFSEENKSKRPNFTFLPFGEGPRNCIGLRFGLMQIRIGLVYMLRNCKITLNSNTPKDIELDPKSGGLLIPLKQILLDVEMITVSEIVV